MIRIENVTKRFDDILALDQVSARIQEGSIFGLVGTNGAGKSTMLRVAAGVLKPESGCVMVDELPVWENPEAKSRICFIPDTAWFFPNATIQVMRDYYMMMYPQFDRQRFDELIGKFDLDPKRKLSGFSKGMKKQAAFCLAMASVPDYLILDEPVDGLDPIVRRKLWHYIMGDVADREMTVLISSHNAKEMEDVCNYIGIIAGGRMIFEGDLLEMIPASVEEIFIEKLEGYQPQNNQEGGAANEE